MKHTFLSGTIAISAIAAVASLQAAPAQAFSWTSNSATFHPGDLAGTDFTVSFNKGYINGALTPGLTAIAKFSLVTAFNGGKSATFKVAVTNTSDKNIFSKVNVSGIGFNTSPGLKGASLNKAPVFKTLAFDSQVPQPSITGGKRDICFSASGCTVGNSGVKLGNTSLFTTTLNFKKPVTSFNLSDFVVSYRNIDFQGVPKENLSGVGVGEVPTPALLPGLIGMGIAAFRKKKRQEKEMQTVA